MTAPARPRSHPRPRVGQCRGCARSPRRLGHTGICRVCVEFGTPAPITRSIALPPAPSAPVQSDPIRADLEIILGCITAAEATLAPLTAEARRLVRIVRTAGSPEAVAVARHEFRLVLRRRRELRQGTEQVAGLGQLVGQRNALVQELLDRDALLEAARDRSDRERDAELAGVEA